MQIQDLRSRYGSAVAQVSDVARLNRAPARLTDGRPKNRDLVSLGNQVISDFDSGGVRHSSKAPERPEIHRHVLHQARVSYADEARVANRIDQLKQLLAQIHQLQNQSQRLGPAVYA